MGHRRGEDRGLSTRGEGRGLVLERLGQRDVGGESFHELLDAGDKSGGEVQPFGGRVVQDLLLSGVADGVELRVVGDVLADLRSDRRKVTLGKSQKESREGGKGHAPGWTHKGRPSHGRSLSQ